MKIGTTSFAFRYAHLAAARAPTLSTIIQQTRSPGVERLQICENVSPLEVPRPEWREAIRCAANEGMELLLGCKTLKAETVERFIPFAHELTCDQLRIVTEEPDEHQTGNRDNVSRLLEAVGSMISFSVVGAPQGEGQLDLAGCLRLIGGQPPIPPLFVETWTPTENRHERDVALDQEWLRRSVVNLQSKLLNHS